MPHPFLAPYGIDERTRIALQTPDTLLQKKATLTEWLLTGGLLALCLSFWSGLSFLGVHLVNPPLSDHGHILHTALGVFWIATLLIGLGISVTAGLAYFLKTQPKKTQPKTKK